LPDARTLLIPAK